MVNFKHLSFASSLCGACTTVCPVRIPIHELLLLNREQSVKEGLANKFEKHGFSLWKKAMLNRSLMNVGNVKIKNIVLNVLFRKTWGKHRSNIKLAPKSFNEMWKEQNK
jgi:L-lactate dehydrogenase complex protein LldF